MREVCVLGLGLIGGSVLRAAGAAGRTVWGATASAEDAAAARAEGFDVLDSVGAALRRAAGRDALVVLAVPLPAVAELAGAIAELAPEVRLTDVVSVKRPVADTLRRRAPRVRYVGGHPMAGRSVSGWDAGSAELLQDAAWVVTTEDGVDPEVWQDVTRLALDCGAEVVPAGIDAHDAAVGRISHLPHVLAAVLASVGADGGPLALSLAAGSFGDGTRVAGSRPELVRAMCEGNRDALLAAVDDALGRLGAARGALASTGSLAATMNSGHQARALLDAERAADTAEREIDLSTPDAFEELRQLGERGGRVRGLAGNGVILMRSRVDNEV